MKRKAVGIEALLLFLALALEKSLAPSTGLTVILFSVVILIGVALLLAVLWEREETWNAIAGKVAPHLPKPETVVVHAHASGPPISGTIPGSATTTPSEEGELASAIDDLLDELATIDHRLADAINDDWYAYNFHLPSIEYHKHKTAISAADAEAREALSAVYVEADRLNDTLGRLAPEGMKVDELAAPDPVRISELVAEAMKRLRKIRPT